MKCHNPLRIDESRERDQCRPTGWVRWLMLAGALITDPVRSDTGPDLLGSGPILTTHQVDESHAYSSSDVSLSLAEAVALGLRRNRNIRRSYLQRVMQKFDLQVAEDFFSPRLLLSAQHQVRRGSREGEQVMSITPKISINNEWGTRFSLSWAQRLHWDAQADNGRQRDLGIEVSQPLLRNAGKGVVTAPMRRARLREQSHRLGLQASVAQNVTAIVSAYRELLKAQEQLRLVAASLDRSRDQIKVNDALIASGRMAQVDRLQNEADVVYQELNAEQAAHQLNAHRRALLQLLALDLSTPLRASDEVVVKPLEIDTEAALRIALERQPSYLQQRIAEDMADIDLLVAKDQQQWDLSLVAGAGQNRQNSTSGLPGGTDHQWRAYASLQLEIPIGDLAERQRLVNAQVAVDKQALQQAEAKQSLAREINDAVRTLQTQWRQYEIALRSRSLSQKKLLVERQKLQVGRTSNFQVLSFEEDLRRSENAVLTAQIAYLNAQTFLDERLGTTLESWEIALND